MENQTAGAHTQETNKTNSLRHNSTAHDSEGNVMTIKIRLNDECKNGHQDFSITGDIYQKGKPRTDNYWLGGGCIHDDILKARPDLKMFVDLHLCDYTGVPTHAVANGFYHLVEGFSKTKPESANFKSEYCDYYRITPEQFDILAQCKNKVQFGLSIINLSILDQWQKQANEAILLLEQWTGNSFVVDSLRTQFVAPTPAEIEEEAKRQREGYYTPEAEQLRELAKRDTLIAELQADADKEIDKANIEFVVKKQVLIIGGEKALKNCIFYTHSKTLSFNWRGYDNISQELIDKVIEEIVLPEGVTIKNDKVLKIGKTVIS